MNCRDLLRSMADAYAQATSYRDDGVVTTTIIHGDRREIGRMPFTTVFQRPDRFRYQLTDETMGSRMFIWQDAPPARLFWTLEKQLKVLDLQTAIASATGVSGGSAHTVPRLLMPQILGGGRPITQMESPEYGGEEAVGSVPCSVIRGGDTFGSVSLWIGTADLLLRRIVRAQHFGAREHAALLAALPEEHRASVDEAFDAFEAFDTNTEIIYEPSKDVVLPFDAFDTPPDVPR